MPPKAASKTAAPSSEPARTYKESDIVLAKVKGYPSWPGRVLDASTASKKVLKDKPLKGKNVYLVQFFPAGDFMWAQPKDLSLLQTKEIDAFLNGPGKKKGDLLQGYQIAKDPSDWITQREDEAAEFQRLEAEAEDDELASESEAAAKPKKGKKEVTKKRKRDSTTATSTATNGAAKKDDKKKPKKETAKSKASVKKDYTDDEAEPASKKAKASGDSDAETVKGWRHRLQKVFLGKTNPPADEMPKCAEIFDAMEKFDMKKEWLVESKLAKVLKRVALLKEDVIPDEEKYNFRQRSSDLAGKWAPLMGGNPAGSPQAEASTSADNAAETAPAAENGTEAAPEAAGEAAEESSEEKKEEPAAMDVDTNGDGSKPEEDNKEEVSKKDEEAPAAQSS